MIIEEQQKILKTMQEKPDFVWSVADLVDKAEILYPEDKRYIGDTLWGLVIAGYIAKTETGDAYYLTDKGKKFKNTVRYGFGNQ